MEIKTKLSIDNNLKLFIMMESMMDRFSEKHPTKEMTREYTLPVGQHDSLSYTINYDEEQVGLNSVTYQLSKMLNQYEENIQQYMENYQKGSIQALPDSCDNDMVTAFSSLYFILYNVDSIFVLTNILAKITDPRKIMNARNFINDYTEMMYDWNLEHKQ